MPDTPLASALATPLLTRAAGWDAVRAGFRWPAPFRGPDAAPFNIAEAVCGRWARANPNGLALIHLDRHLNPARWSHGALWEASGRLASAFAAHGLARGSRVALVLPQSPEALITHLACWRLGAVSVPLFTLFGEDGLRYRMADSGAVFAVTDAEDMAKIDAIRADLPALRQVFCIDGPMGGALGLMEEAARASAPPPTAATTFADPAFISYTSGTTGPPKGALHGHSVLLGHMPGFEAHHDFAPHDGSLFWTPADWAWMGGLCNLLLPALAYGSPVLSHRMARFDAEGACWIMAQEGVRRAFLPPTALKLMRAVKNPRGLGVKLASVGSAGEALGAELLDWGVGALGLTINEFFGQTEANLVLTNASSVFAPKPGSAGRSAPGHNVCIIDAEGRALPPGEDGEIAVDAPNPTMFLRYWNLPEKTAEKYAVDPETGVQRLRTGDVGRIDEEGHVFFSSRADDVITTSGYRVGPSEVEDCLAGHPDVAMAGVIGVPDPVRTEVIRAYVVTAPGAQVDAEKLEAELIARVRGRLSPHLAPRRVEVIDALPMTATGKIMRRELKRRAQAQAQQGEG
ncbi:AMP-binding protein [Rhodovulum sp. DZ06]|uniref:AMP-binding protein n=1 Tax=Rhodovulum sp. DZ06 TaxID=3425126 RepID=UPI003D331C52